MSGADTIERAAAGELPAWAEMRAARREHVRRVVGLLDDWAGRLRLADRDRARWRAAAWLHDALRDADGERLRRLVPARTRDWPAPLLHGPAAAARLADAGVDDRELLDAVAWHTTGHPALGRLGRFLYLADYLEPGRSFDPAGRAAWRARMPAAADEVLTAVVRERVRHLLETGRPIRPETAAFWTAVVRAAA